MTDLRRLIRPATVHAASLVVGFAALLVIGRGQWFYFDDWAIMHPGMDGVAILASHVGHWNSAATIMFQVLRAVAGLHTYLPYLALAFVAHLAVVHLTWRVMLRVGAGPWLATGLAAALIPLGSAAENVLWGFQVGFMGAIALGLVTLLAVDRRTLGRMGIAVAVAASVLSLTFSGTALPLIAGAAVLSWIRRGWWRSLLLFLPAGLIYLAWYLAFGFGQSNPLAPHGAAWLTSVPRYFLTMFGAGYGEFVGILILGPVIALGLAFWLVRRFRHWRGIEAPAYALLLASAVFAALTAASRAGGGITAAGAQRYVYVIVVLAVPTMALALTWIIARGRPFLVGTAVAVAAVGIFNLVLLVDRAGEQADVESQTWRQISAAVAIVEREPGLSDDLQPMATLAPDLHVSDIRDIIDEDLLTPIHYSAADAAAVEESLGQ